MRSVREPHTLSPPGASHRRSDHDSAPMDLPRKHAIDAYTMAEQHETNPRSVWGYVQGLTRLSQHTSWQDTRFTLDRAASRLLATVH